MALVAAGGTAARCQSVIDVPLEPLYGSVGYGTGGGRPAIIARAESPTGKTVDNLQPASYIEWKVSCGTPGMYRIAISLAQWQDPRSVLAVETRPLIGADTPTVTRYGAPDTRDYGQTLGPWNFMDLGDLEDAEGNTLLLPLFAGENILRFQNVSGRHNPAYTYPTDMRDTHNRDWDFYWSNVHVGSIRLTRAGDLPAFGTITGNVLADRPAGLGVRRALVTANPPGDAPPEPSAFWKNGWYTYTADDGSFTLNAPAGAQDLKAGRPGSYQVQGSPIATVDVPVDGSLSADLTLSSLFHDDGQGRQVAEIQNVYFDQAAGNVGILPVDGENGYKVGWIDPADSTTIYVDVPRTGLYKVASSYFNGGTDGTVRISTDRGSSTQALQPVTGWDRQGLVNYPDPLYLVQGTNAVTMTLVSGSSDQNAFHLTMPPVTVGDAAGALRIAAGLSPAADADLWTGTITGGPQITLEDAARLLLAATGHPL